MLSIVSIFRIALYILSEDQPLSDTNEAMSLAFCPFKDGLPPETPPKLDLKYFAAVFAGLLLDQSLSDHQQLLAFPETSVGSEVLEDITRLEDEPVGIICGFIASKEMLNPSGHVKVFSDISRSQSSSKITSFERSVILGFPVSF